MSFLSSAGCKAVLRRQDLRLHDDSCPRSSRHFENELHKMEEVEKRLIMPSLQMRYHQLADEPTTAGRRSSQPGNCGSTYVLCGIPRNIEDALSIVQPIERPPPVKAMDAAAFRVRSTVPPSETPAHRPSLRPSPAADPHETLRQEAINVSRRSSVVPVPDHDQSDGSSPGSRSGMRTSQSNDSIRREALEVSRRSSWQNSGRSLSGADVKYSNGRANGVASSRTNGLSDETLEQLEKARLALERESIDVQDGVSYLPDVIAQRINNEDVELRDRVEKLEDLVATSRAQLEKAFAENRNLRALLASEHKLRELHVTKLRDEVEILRSMVYRSLRGGSNGDSCSSSSSSSTTTTGSSTLNNVNQRAGRESSLD
ncbi:hypothetical protein BIW11_14320 [Tropilaelaps mercedesae]|uniref:Uncharacterized protein n=1 Tax=Tropilaelaps mercedesae TaxID=418985 RepID=A0A1V9WYF6_9ACAR|nr:hypothetical protein BIW11_14320 [Tropilaelaps mercedesae]